MLFHRRSTTVSLETFSFYSIVDIGCATFVPVREPNKSCDVKFEGLRKLLKNLFPNFEVENEKIGRSVHECRFRFVFVAEQYAFILMVGKQLPLLLKCSVARNFAKITKSLCLNFSIIN